MSKLSTAKSTNGCPFHASGVRCHGPMGCLGHSRQKQVVLRPDDDGRRIYKDGSMPTFVGVQGRWSKGLLRGTFVADTNIDERQVHPKYHYLQGPLYKVQVPEAPVAFGADVVDQATKTLV